MKVAPAVNLWACLQLELKLISLLGYAAGML